jgi:SAM-dependent methyltransferase
VTSGLRGTLAVVRRIEAGGPRLVTAIHPGDEAFRSVLDHADRIDNPQSHYFAVGERMLERLRDLFARLELELEDARAFLEVGSGHGRFTRHLVRVLDPPCITVCDRDETAIDFLAGKFGVTGLVAPSAPEDLEFPGRYDHIFAASLFGHLPDGAFGRWLGRLYDALDDGGTLWFSTHGPGCLPEGRALPEGGILHHETSSILAHVADDAGTSWVTPQYVADVVRERTGQDLALAVERGLFNIQDVYAVRKPAATDHASPGGASARR